MRLRQKKKVFSAIFSEGAYAAKDFIEGFEYFYAAHVFSSIGV